MIRRARSARLTALRAALASLLAVAAAGDARAANPDFTCVLGHRSATYDSLKALPPDFRKTVADKIGVMADRGEFFNATDVIMRPGPGRRLIRAGASGGYRYIWYEQGGIAYRKQIVIFATDPNGRVHVLADETARGNLCAETDRLLGRPGPGQ